MLDGTTMILQPPFDLPPVPLTKTTWTLAEHDARRRRELNAALVEAVAGTWSDGKQAWTLDHASASTLTWHLAPCKIGKRDTTCLRIGRWSTDGWALEEGDRMLPVEMEPSHEGALWYGRPREGLPLTKQ